MKNWITLIYFQLVIYVYISWYYILYSVYLPYEGSGALKANPTNLIETMFLVGFWSIISTPYSSLSQMSYHECLLILESEKKRQT